MKKSERVLLSLFVLLLVGGGALVLFDLYRERRDAFVVERDKLELELVEIEELLEDRQFWERRSTWLEEKLPPFTSDDRVSNAIYADARAGRALGVTTSAIQLLDTAPVGEFLQARVSLTATGTVKDVFGWLHELQRPESFRSIRNLRITPDPEDDGKIVCKMELVRWYARQDSKS